jgi:hypothetical protein
MTRAASTRALNNAQLLKVKVQRIAVFWSPLLHLWSRLPETRPAFSIDA